MSTPISAHMQPPSSIRHVRSRALESFLGMSSKRTPRGRRPPVAQGYPDVKNFTAPFFSDEHYTSAAEDNNSSFRDVEPLSFHQNPLHKPKPGMNYVKQSFACGLPSPAAVRDMCFCGQIAEEDTIYCSVKCAREDSLNSLCAKLGSAEEVPSHYRRMEREKEFCKERSGSRRIKQSHVNENILKKTIQNNSSPADPFGVVQNANDIIPMGTCPLNQDNAEMDRVLSTSGTPSLSHSVSTRNSSSTIGSAHFLPNSAYHTTSPLFTSPFNSNCDCEQSPIGLNFSRQDNPSRILSQRKQAEFTARRPERIEEGEVLEEVLTPSPLNKEFPHKRSHKPKLSFDDVCAIMKM